MGIRIQGRALRILTAGVVCGATGVLFAAAMLLFLPFPVSTSEIQIEKGSNAAHIARVLRANRVIGSEFAFRLSTRLLGASTQLKPGRYAFTSIQNNYRILRTLRNGWVIQTTVTLPEGISSRRMAGLMAREMGIDSSVFLGAVRDPATVKRLGLDAPTLEGYLYPDTYRLSTSATVDEILTILVGRFRRVFNDSLLARCAETGLTQHQAVTLASIIEGEAMLGSERTVISAVYHNRLRKGMALQACPTVQFLIPGGPRRLLNRDLLIQSPYNTYLHPGLPPGPVNNPGRASILAALYPAPVNYLYMVANGDGSHTFSTNLDDHNRAKQRLNRLRVIHSRHSG